MSKPLLEIKNIHKHFGNQHVLNGIDLDIYEKEVVLLLDHQVLEKQLYFVA